MATDKNESKKNALETAIAQIEKQCGKGSIMRLGANTHMGVTAMPTGSLTLDFALGIGGVPKGRITEIYGPESSGKTTVALHVIANVQARGGEAAFIDAEHALDPVYAKALGVDIDNLLISQPNSGEQALEITEALIRSGAIDVIVIDSVAALVPQNEIDGDMGQATMGVQARLMSQALRKLSGAISKTNTVVIFINQLRSKIGVLYGPSETTTGGNALKFYASVRIDIRRTEQIKAGTDVIGNHVRCKIVKNKVAPPFKVAEFDILYGKGISKESEILDMAVNYNIISKSGSWYSYDGQRVAQGKDSAREYLVSNKALCAEIEEKIRKKFLESKNQSGIDSTGTDDEIGENIQDDNLDE
ncbi:MAG TPA: recombinase RecA [Bacillota bacterium]|nr:recombinase RecA [Bacillota bacterium]